MVDGRDIFRCFSANGQHELPARQRVPTASPVCSFGKGERCSKRITLQRHFSASTKFAHVKSRLCGRKQRGKEAFCTPINPCARRACSRSIVVGLVYCYIKSFQRAASVEKPWPGGEKRGGGRPAHPVAW